MEMKPNMQIPFFFVIQHEFDSIFVFIPESKYTKIAIYLKYRIKHLLNLWDNFDVPNMTKSTSKHLMVQKIEKALVWIVSIEMLIGIFRPSALLATQNSM